VPLDAATSPQLVFVELTPVEMEIAAFVAAKRQVENLTKCRIDAYGAPKDSGWSLHIEGAAGEMAVAKWSGRYWNGNLGDLGADDVGRLQVRTRSRHDYELIIHPSDRDDRAFVLVTGLAPNFVLRGWIWGREAKREEWWRDPAGDRPAYFVPQSALRPMVKPSRDRSNATG
jgi:hypothetical protein